MIVVDRITWLRVILRWHGSALQKVWRRVLFSTVLATGVTVTYQYQLCVGFLVVEFSKRFYRFTIAFVGH